MSTRAIAWGSAIWLPLGLLPLAWMSALAAGFCNSDCGTFETLATYGLIAACVVLLLVWIGLVIGMIRGPLSRGMAIAALAADAALLALFVFAAVTFGAA